MSKRNTILLWVILIILVLGLAKCRFNIGTSTSYTSSNSIFDEDPIDLEGLTAISKIPKIPEIPEIPAIPEIPDLAAIDGIDQIQKQLDAMGDQLQMSDVNCFDLIDSIPCPIIIKYNSPQRVGNMTINSHVFLPRDYEGSGDLMNPKSKNVIYVEVMKKNESSTSLNLGLYSRVKVRKTYACSLKFPVEDKNGVRTMRDTLTFRELITTETRGLSNQLSKGRGLKQQTAADFKKTEHRLIQAILRRVSKYTDPTKIGTY